MTNRYTFEEILGEDYENKDYLDFLLYGDGDFSGVNFIEQDGGGEGGSEYCYTILEKDGRYFKTEYSYYSYHGYDNYGDSFVEVYPKQVTVTQYVSTPQ
ncbi:hypothetical protein [Vibrio phage TCU-VP03-AIR1]